MAAERKLRLEIQQSDEHGECGKPKVPRWYGQNSITTNDITGSVVKILITDSKGKQISITIGNNGSIREVNENTETEEDHGIWISPNNSQDIPPDLVNNQQSTSSKKSIHKVSNSNSLCVKEELKDCEESAAPESSISFQELVEVISGGYNLETLEPEVEDEFHKAMEKMKTEEASLAGKFETVYIDSEMLLPDNDEVPRAEKSSELSGGIFEPIIDITASLLCRLCATRRKDMVYIFETNEAYKNIVEKIQNCLPILVKETDSLPKQVCRLCLEKLELCHKFHKTVVEAEKQFNILGGKKSDEFKNTEKNEKALPPQNGQPETKKPAQKLVVTDKKTSSVKSSSLPVTHSIPKPLNKLKKLPDKKSVDNDIIFVGTAEVRPESDQSDETDIIKCRICGLFFGTARSCYTHSNIHYSENHYPCSMCNTIFTTKAEIFKHSLQHTVRKPFQRRAPIYNRHVSIYDQNSTLENIANENNAGGKDGSGDQSSTAQSDDMIKCKICGLYFGTPKSCYIHSAIHASEDNMPCGMCDKTFTNEEDSYLHSLEHIVPRTIRRRSEIYKKKQSENKVQSLPIIRSNRLPDDAVKKIHGKDKSEDNITCAKETDNNEASIDQSNGNDMIKCRICGEAFPNAKSCYFHGKIHVKEKQYPCTMCYISFKTEQQAYKHSQDHVIGKANERRMAIHVCSTCGKRFVTAERLKFHQVYHNNPKKKPCYCEKCDKVLASESSLYHHTVNVHKREEQHVCNVCGKRFSDQSQLNSHKTTHMVRPFECSLCDKKFFSNDKLKLHRQQNCRILPKTKNFSCFYCGKTFLRKWTLTNHITKHTGAGRPYRCDFCPKTYLTSQSRGRHQSTHTDGENPENRSCDSTDMMDIHMENIPYGCFLCSKLFDTVKTREEHIQAVHNGDKQYECNVSEKSFENPNTTHMRKKTRHRMK